MAKILVTEDSIYMRRVVTTMVREAGHTVVEAADGDECLRQIAAEAPDLLLLDLVMPGRDGLSVLGELAKSESSLPVVVLSADIQESVRRGCLELGAKAFLNKPPKKEALLAAIRQALGEANRDTER